MAADEIIAISSMEHMGGKRCLLLSKTGKVYIQKEANEVGWEELILPTV